VVILVVAVVVLVQAAALVQRWYLLSRASAALNAMPASPGQFVVDIANSEKAPSAARTG